MGNEKKRLEEFIRAKGISIREFERRAGLSNGYMKALRKSPTVGKMQSIIRAFPELNRDWVETGEGEMLVADGAQQDSKQEVTPDIIPNAAPSEEASEIEYAGENKNDGVFFRDRNGRLYISVPHVPYAAHGEYPNLSDSLEPTSEWGREIYEVDRKAYGKYISFDVLGNSMNTGMYGSLRDGDKVLVRELERDNWRTLRVGDHRFWVLVFGPSVLIKEITHFDPVTGIVTCHSLNPSPEYHDFDIPLDSVRNLYYVIRIKPREIAVI